MKKVAQINTKVKVSSTFSKVAGSRGGAPRRCSAIVNKVYCEIPLFQKNGARGEKCESISRGGVQDRLPFLHTQANLPSKTFRWNVLDKATPPSFLYNLHKVNIFFDRLMPREHCPRGIYYIICKRKNLRYSVSSTAIRIGWSGD